MPSKLGWWMGLSCCEGEQSTKFNYSVITHWVNNRLSGFSFPLLKYASRRINSRAKDKFWWQSFLNMLFWKLLLRKTLQLGNWRFMIFKERAVFHTVTARNPLDSDPWQCSFSHQLYFFCFSQLLPVWGASVSPSASAYPYSPGSL